MAKGNGLHTKSRSHNLDAVNYGGADSGCDVATTFLGFQSNCLECPFSKCVYDREDGNERAPKLINILRNEQIMKQIREGRTRKEIATSLKISVRAIYDILKAIND